MKSGAVVWTALSLMVMACQPSDRAVIRPVAKEKAPTTMVLPSAERFADFAMGSVFFIGNATVLIRYAGFTILTDPTFIHQHGEVSLGYGLKTTRLTNPAVDIHDLPPLDLIVLSHFHLALPDVMGSMLEFQSASEGVKFRIYITGDTLVIDELKEIPRRYPDIDLALLHLGGTRVLGLLVTMDGKQGVEAMRIVNPDRAIPIHYNDYDRFQSPLSDFQDEVKAAGLQDRVHYLKHGETYNFEVRASAVTKSK